MIPASWSTSLFLFPILKEHKTSGSIAVRMLACCRPSLRVSHYCCWPGKRPAAESGPYLSPPSSLPTLPHSALMMLEWEACQPLCPHPPPPRSCPWEAGTQKRRRDLPSVFRMGQHHSRSSRDHTAWPITCRPPDCPRASHLPPSVRHTHGQTSGPCIVFLPP